MVSAAIVPAAPAAAGVGGVTDISDRQEAASCGYARGHAPAAKRPGYARACRAAANAERATNAVAAAAAGEPFTYENPVYGSSFPDPGAFANGSTDYYAYATGGRFPIIKSSDLVHWEVVGHAFSARPSWVVQSGDWHPWAPSVLSSPRACPGTTSPGCYF
ncbi:MAG TPA: family 43 glycosylhydrolase, partial [Asanoa sp.]